MPMANRKKTTGKKTGKKTAGKKTAGEKTVEKKTTSGKEKARLPSELDGVRKTIEAARVKLDSAEKEARALAREARKAYRESVARYRAVCRRAGVECEFEGTRRASLTERVSFLLEKTEEGVRVMIKGRPETEQVIPIAELEESLTRAAYSYTERYLGPREKIGNKGGGLSNRLRALWR